jgi:hypothetical protein
MTRSNKEPERFREPGRTETALVSDRREARDAKRPRFVV